MPNAPANDAAKCDEHVGIGGNYPTATIGVARRLELRSASLRKNGARTMKCKVFKSDSARHAPRVRIRRTEVSSESPLAERSHLVTLRSSVAAAICALGVFGAVSQMLAPPASAVPGPEVEYTYDVIVRRHFDFPNNDAIGYGYGICDKVTRGQGYGDLMGDVKRDVFPNDEQAANYVASYAVGILCPAQIWRLRNSAAGYVPPPS